MSSAWPAPFAERLVAACRTKRSPVCVGLDPRLDQLPEPLRPPPAASPVQVAQAFVEFCRGVIDVVAPLAPVVKPQLAFFEQLGLPGLAALDETIAAAHARGLLVILDGKRNDIGSTGEAYADAYLGPASAWRGDALTVSPYLGEDSLQPFADACVARGAGLFVLVKTSNPGSGQLQDVTVEGRPLYRRVADVVERFSAAHAGAAGYGPVGAVVGATYPAQLVELRAAMPHAFLLVPGYGSQGGTASDVAAAFDAQGTGAVINNSRGLIFAHRRREYAESFGDARWQGAVEAATRAMLDELRSATSAGRLG
jgi:orotidine-5'-phosphate decarboxylase